jgi:hypothetical protein
MAGTGDGAMGKRETKARGDRRGFSFSLILEDKKYEKG